VYLLIANSFDSFCESVSGALQARGMAVRVLANPFAAPPHFSWRLNDKENISRLRWNGEEPLDDADIDGVLVRNGVFIDHEGWQPDDLAYMQSETQAAMLGWLWSLPCPVINRYPASVWYRPVTPLLSWHSLLSRCGLKTPETVVSNVPSEARLFGSRLKDKLVYAPLTNSARYLIGAEEDWKGLEAMQSCAPVCLAQPHGAAQLVCIVGDRVIWDGAAPSNARAFEPALRRFAEEAGLSFLQLAMAETADDDLRVVQVEPYPRIEQFGEAARRKIVSDLTQLLIAGRFEQETAAEYHSMRR
jgi:hypothetical protein